MEEIRGKAHLHVPDSSFPRKIQLERGDGLAFLSYVSTSSPDTPTRGSERQKGGGADTADTLLGRSCRWPLRPTRE
jgi:hypothetical protein